MASSASRPILASRSLSAVSVLPRRTQKRRWKCRSLTGRFFAKLHAARGSPRAFTLCRPRVVFPMILLIGNYPLDRQQSMQRFAMMMLLGLTAAGVSAELIQPAPFFGRFRYAGGFIAKWLGYLDKFFLFRRTLAKKLRERPALV